MGERLALMNGQTLQKAFVPLPGGGTAVYTSSGLSYYRHSDWLGSSRLASTPTRTVYSTTAYAPFGEPYAQSGTADLSFTGQNQDTVGGSYDFLAREYAIQGRWPSPDPAGLAAMDLGNPQSLDRYVYALNLPTGLVDPLGLASCKRDDTCDDKNARYHQFSDAVGTGNCLLNWMPAPCQAVNYYLQTGLGYIDFGPNWKFKGNTAYGTNCYVGVIVDAAFCLGDYPTPNSGGQGSTLWLQTKVLYQALRKNWNDVLQHDCAVGFVQRVANDYVPTGAPSTDDLLRQGSAAAATTYQMAQGLTVPMRSSIYRGILSGGEKLAGWVTVGEFIHSEWNSLKEEVQAVKEGTCQGW
jgi:RHS repeat-associated protein